MTRGRLPGVVSPQRPCQACSAIGGGGGSTRGLSPPSEAEVQPYTTAAAGPVAWTAGPVLWAAGTSVPCWGLL